jgi:NADPH-dependent ferric siderophore reductase
VAFKDASKERGLYQAEVVRRQQVSPHMVRLTFGGNDLTGLPHHGFDHWFRLFLPAANGLADFSRLPDQFGMAGYLRFLTTPAGRRPIFRSYTVRNHRPELGEIDVDFVIHGQRGVAGPWAQRAEAGEVVALINQGCGFDLLPGTDFHLLAGDESALPAILGILGDLPSDAKGLALIEIPVAEDAQPVAAPAAVEVRWLPRDSSRTRPGQLALAAVRNFVPESTALSAYLAGEQRLASEGRRQLLSAGVAKTRISFAGYWRADKTVA